MRRTRAQRREARDTIGKRGGGTKKWQEIQKGVDAMWKKGEIQVEGVNNVDKRVLVHLVDCDPGNLANRKGAEREAQGA